VGHVTISLPDDVKQISWAAEQLGIGTSTAYRLVAAGKIPGAFKVGAQWRISVPRFLAEVHGEPTALDRPRRGLVSRAASTSSPTHRPGPGPAPGGRGSTPGG
jgi:excisionase family DNA binding protein